MKKLCCVSFSLLLVLLLLPANVEAQDNPGKYEYSGRDARQDPQHILEVLAISEGMVIGEAGAGGGYFTEKLARAVGPTGKIYANDIKQHYLDYVSQRMRKQDLYNVETVLGTESDPLFPDGSLDLSFMLNVYHHISDPVTFLHNLKPDLKPGGVVAIVESDKERRPHASHATDPHEAIRAAEEAGYELVELNQEHPKDFILIIRPVDSTASK